MNRSQDILNLLRKYESRNVTHIEPGGAWPIVWDSAKGVHVIDAEGKRYLDLTAAFGVAAAGHSNGAVVKAAQEQIGRLPHAMGDVHPHASKALLAERLSSITFGRWAKEHKAPPSNQLRFSSDRGKVIFCNSGFEAVEAALKTAFLATGRRKVLAFQNSYHGLGYGALTATERSHFRSPFKRQLASFAEFAPFPVTAAQFKQARPIIRDLARRQLGAVLVEPIQGRGGFNVPAPGFLSFLRDQCDQAGAVLIADEIFTGFGRTGRWFACEHEPVVPDIICLGKALTGGFPLSACVGKADCMDAAWPPSTGEAIHTSTFLGNPVGCAMALAQIREIHRRRLVEKGASVGEWLERELKSLRADGMRFSVRGRGLMLGLRMTTAEGLPATSAVLDLVKRMLQKGFILLPEGPDGGVLSFTPPLIITRQQLKTAITALKKTLNEIGE